MARAMLSMIAMQSAIPGLLVVFTCGRTRLTPITLRNQEVFTIGREELYVRGITDPLVSRRHAEVRFDGTRWTITDLGSSNGTRVDGMRITRHEMSTSEAVLRVGETLFLLREDLRPFLSSTIEVPAAYVAGPKLHGLMQRTMYVAAESRVMHFVGEAGSGKAFAARRLHQSRHTIGPFLVVDCASSPALVTKLSQHDDLEGTLLLQNVDALSATGRIELARMLTKTAASNGRLSICTTSQFAASTSELGEELAAVLGPVTIRLPPLRQRREEVALLIENVLTGMKPHATFVEAALVRAWAGNIRELLTHVRAAQSHAIDTGKSLLMAADL